MVCIAAEKNDSRARLIRQMLHSLLIPCAVGCSERLLRYASVVICFIGDDCECTERVVMCDGAALSSRERCGAELERLVARIEDVFLVKYGADPYTVERGAFYDGDDITRYRGRECRFTFTERMILRFLASVGEMRADALTVSEYCLSEATSPQAVSVHVNKINGRAYIISPIALISTKRHAGYRLSCC